MLCDICKKNPATIHLKEISNGETKETNLCSSCAANQKLNGGFSALGFNLAEMLCNLGKSAKSDPDSPPVSGKTAPRNPDDESTPPPPRCPNCSWTLEDVQRHHGLLGCPECYKSFENMISEAIKNVHRGALHLGKRPSATAASPEAARRFELHELRNALEKHLKREEYEQAAVCRDRIRELMQTAPPGDEHDA